MLFDNTPIGRHFVRGEFTRSTTAARKGIDNTPPEMCWERLTALVENVIDPLRDVFGPIRITSGYRSPALNAAVGGAPSSKHMIGEAADVEPVDPKYTTRDLFLYIVDKMKFDQVIWEFGGAWVHVSWSFLGPQRNEVLDARLVTNEATGRKRTTYVVLTSEIIDTMRTA